MRQQPRAGNLTFCYRKKQIDVSVSDLFSTENGFRHNIVKLIYSYFDNVMTKFVTNA